MVRKLIRQVVIVECVECAFDQEFPTDTIAGAVRLADEAGWLADPEQDYFLCPDCAQEIEDEERELAKNARRSS